MTQAPIASPLSFHCSLKGFLNDHVLVVFGFAAGCESVALPRRQWPDNFGLCPWFGLSPFGFLEPKAARRA
jgi:hypothetical protein